MIRRFDSSLVRRIAASAMRYGLCLGLGCAGREARWTQEPLLEPRVVGSQEQVGIATLLERARAGWADRGQRRGIELAIASWERAAILEPHNVELLVDLTRAYYFLADAYLRGEEVAYLAALDRAVRWGERALLSASPEFERRVRGGERYVEAIGAVPLAAVPAMYWYASALGKWAQRKGLAVMLGQRDTLRATMNRVLELDPRFFHGGPHRYFGAYYAVAPELAGGDLEKAKVHFKKALQVAPNYLATKVLWAEELAVRQGDQELFRRLLIEVLETPDDVIPDFVPETVVEKQKARELLVREAELF